MRVIGLMSGTSYDAVDAAAADLRVEAGTLRLTPLGLISQAYDTRLRNELAAALPPAATTLETVCRLDARIGQAFAELAARADRELCDGRADLVASHGQTVFHWTDGGRVHGSLQIGQPAWIAERTGRPVVSDFRPRDIAAGGQGAPLVAVVDVMWLRDRPGRPVALNLGGIANITVPGGDGREPLAYDTGPANALVDAAVRHLTGGRRDIDAEGAMAARGTVHRPLLERLLAEPYYARPAPKTTGKELFHEGHLLAALDGLALPAPLPADDVVATVTALAAHTVADAVRSHAGTEVIASGGGTRNPTLMRMLAAALPGIPVRTSDALGLPAAAKEAYAFAVLGFLTLHGLAGTVPACTGARHAAVLGSLTPGAGPLRLPPPVQGGAPTRLRVDTSTT
ncbi:anhydro-N-acetylmuramic acid kinase [Streptomyces sp. UNOB3_S3]|uniref:anhydro-N-acetylmuramic acid kinase n=1 Tax=Streptomyces sp. UNOB3_S3 TaxID=2871682 RepID=UPI001E3EF416|nr:anhydro-N-acetylmuramic acid kinase [Streptomyces sp. UNOB3_S3]MCC3776486.1 anhydro-N-acetylmuramic acid kinase [Streptomyces sp. UNOB3_S3]